MQATIEMKIFQNIFKLSIFMIKQETYAVEKGNCDKNQSPPSHPLKYPTVPPLSVLESKFTLWMYGLRSEL